MVRKIGISTGGGDCPGLNAVIRAVVRAARLHYRWDIIGIEDGFDGLIYARNLKPLGLVNIAGILHRGGTILGTTNRGNPFRHTTVEDGKTVVKDLTPKILDTTNDIEEIASPSIKKMGRISKAQTKKELKEAVKETVGYQRPKLRIKEKPTPIK